MVIDTTPGQTCAQESVGLSPIIINSRRASRRARQELSNETVMGLHTVDVFTQPSFGA